MCGVVQSPCTQCVWYRAITLHSMYVVSCSHPALNVCGIVQSPCTQCVWCRAITLHSMYVVSCNHPALNVCGVVQSPCTQCACDSGTAQGFPSRLVFAQICSAQQLSVVAASKLLLFSLCFFFSNYSKFNFSLAAPQEAVTSDILGSGSVESERVCIGPRYRSTLQEGVEDSLSSFEVLTAV